ncbi:MAG: hypothetical protein ACRCVI_00030 [Mycoplasmoidaceae bacterium]
MKKVILAEVIKIESDHLEIKFHNETFQCSKNDVSDYNCDLWKMFSVNRKYKFSVLRNKENQLYISYKTCRPKLLKNKCTPIPTISGFKNLSNHMHNYLKEYKIVEKK